MNIIVEPKTNNKKLTVKKNSPIHRKTGLITDERNVYRVLYKCKSIPIYIFRSAAGKNCAPSPPAA